MRLSIFFLLCGGLLSSCGGGESQTLPSGDDDDDVVGDDDDTVPTATSGLESRPDNPDCVAWDRPLSGAEVSLQRVYAGVSINDAMWLGHSPHLPGYWYVATLDGLVQRFEDQPGVASVTTVLDIRGRVATGSEAGLLSMAIDPDFATSGDIYVSYTASGLPYVSRISRFHSDDGGVSFDPLSEEILISVDQPFTNHNGGHVAFGPDGYLYWGLGDGGSGGDPLNSGQDVTTLLGSLLRLDVTGGDPYGIPADNPFADGIGGRAEIYAWGLRNPFRFSFDPQTGQLWLGDVGQNDWEEIDLIERGGNYGWRVTEGAHCYAPAVGCDTAGLIPPVVEYPNNGASVIAGVAYYGSEIPELNGTVLYIDYYQGDLFGVAHDPVTGAPQAVTLAANTGRNLTAFATGPDDEAYAIDRWSGVYRLERNGAAGPDPFPALLSQTGCFLASDPTTPVAGMIDYSLNHPFWSDGADKERFMAIPNGSTIAVGDTGAWTFPVGSILAKHFRVAGDLVETRLFLRHDDGAWAGYAYAWNEDGSDATLLSGGQLLDLDGQAWSIPSRSDCLQCHSQALGATLGVETAQMNVAHVYRSTGLFANQIATLDHVGLFEASPGAPEALEVLPSLTGTATVEEKARAYLHVNCAQCHQPGGNGLGEMDLRWDSEDLEVCDVSPQFGDLGVAGGALVYPGDPTRSILSLRIRSRDAYGMPPLGSHVVDEVGAQQIDDWISSLTSCP